MDKRKISLWQTEIPVSAAHPTCLVNTHHPVTTEQLSLPDIISSPLDPSGCSEGAVVPTGSAGAVAAVLVFPQP